MSALFGAATVVRPAAPGCSATSEPWPRGPVCTARMGCVGPACALRVGLAAWRSTFTRRTGARRAWHVAMWTFHVARGALWESACLPTFEPGLPPHLRRDCPHICAGTAPTSAPGLPPHLRRDCRHICAGTWFDGCAGFFCMTPFTCGTRNVAEPYAELGNFRRRSVRATMGTPKNAGVPVLP